MKSIPVGLKKYVISYCPIFTENCHFRRYCIVYTYNRLVSVTLIKFAVIYLFREKIATENVLCIENAGLRLIFDIRVYIQCNLDGQYPTLRDHKST